MLDKNETVLEKKMILTNFKYNAIGGIDAERTLESGEIVPYTLTAKEQTELTEDIAGSREATQSELETLTLTSDFKATRQSLIDTATVEANGFIFDADEISIGRLANAILATLTEHDSYVIQWSLSDTKAGVMTDVTLADLKLAHQLAVLNMSSVWSI
jgi:hypothetical protein|tara:strand:- start:72 stop:545 length:474 start_codon:yes stop_codon:yes gene_type:complete